MLSDERQRVRRTLLNAEESRLTDLLKASQDTEDLLFIEGKHVEAIRQGQITRETKRELERVRAETRTLEN